MTANTKKVPLGRISQGTFFLCFAIIFFLALILKSPEITTAHIKNGLRLCATAIIPSLFPFMVVSEILVTSGLGAAMGHLLGKPLSRFLGISREVTCALLLGFLCGFPVGTKTAASLYDKGDISKKEFQRLLTFCNVPSSGFLISTVGLTLFGNRGFGIFLYLCVIALALFFGLGNRFFHKSDATNISQSTPQTHIIINVNTLTNAVSAATASVLSICAYILFFSALIGCLSPLLALFSVPLSARAFLFCLFEISSGAKAASLLESPMLAATLCGFAVGWSGLSVHFQIMSLAANRDIDFRPYWLSKFLQGLFCALVSFLYANIYPLTPTRSQQAGILWLHTPHSPYVIAVLVLFSAGVLLVLLSHFGGFRNCRPRFLRR